MRQAEDTELAKDGWVQGDAWFGLTPSVVELKYHLGVSSIFEQNLQYFPMQVLHVILLAHHPKRPACHWVMMKATIEEVDHLFMVKQLNQLHC